MPREIQLVEYVSEGNAKFLNSPKVDGYYKTQLFENMSYKQGEGTANAVFSNAYKAMDYFANPNERPNVTKMLCLGKVQSGKTAFFISVIALAFDNGYDVAFLLGGTKNTLRDQNYERVENEFSNNPKVKVVELNKVNGDDIAAYVKNGYKVVAVVLKNAAEKRNIGRMQAVMQYNSDCPMVIIDDEGDEYSPGAPKVKARNPKAGKTHDAIVDLLGSASCVTYLAVTATPQANLLLSTIDELSPEHVVLVEPGKGYTGGNSFHDTIDNPHVIQIKDSDDFEDSIPESFKDALYYFIFACALRVTKGDDAPYSMLVHPSSLTKVHEMVAEKIQIAYEYIWGNLSDRNNIAYEDQCEKIKEKYNEYSSEYDVGCSFEEILQNINEVLGRMQVLQVNAISSDEQYEGNRYVVYVGGNMLGRGLTIKNLCVTYIYRESKETAIDTLYQRARWFGYKSRYFDICRVYMTAKLKQAFIDTVASENDMWNAIRAFLLTKADLKQLPRVFRLDNDKLILTRKSVSRTITLHRVNPGYSYNRSVLWSTEAKEHNRKLFDTFFAEWKTKGFEKQFGTSEHQTHYIIEMPFSCFFESFLKKYIFPRETSFGTKGFEQMLETIRQGAMEDIVRVVVMRYKTMQYRALSLAKYSIKELPQSWNEGTKYPGDKFLDGLQDKFHFQIHLVYVDENRKNEYMPMIAMNNPITEFSARYVTGDNYYETV